VVGFLLAATLLWSADAVNIGWEARDAEKRGDVVRAYALYSQAAKLDPANAKYAAKAFALQRSALTKAKVTMAPLPERDDPAPPLPEVTDQDRADIARLKPPPDLRPRAGRHDFRLRAPFRDVWTSVLKTCELEVVFDTEYNLTQPLPFTLDQATCAEAIHALESATKSFIVPIAERLVLVAQDSPPKRQEQERMVAISIPLPEPVAVAEVQELARAVQQAFEIQRFAIDSVARIVMLRDRYSKARAAQAVFVQMMQRRPQVFLDIDFIEIQSRRDYSFGLSLPTATQLLYFGGWFRSQPSIPSGVANFLTFGGGLSLFGFGVASAELLASMTDARSSVLYHAEMRSLDNQAASLHIGDRFPIVTATYAPGTEGDGNTFLPPPTIQFEDLGLTLKITPRIHDETEVTLNVESEFKVLTGETLNDIPVISNRKYLGQVRLRAGEWAVAAGLISTNELRNAVGIPGLSQIPGVGLALRRNERSKSLGQTMLVVKPRIVGLGADESLARGIWIGSETRPLPPL
jgi:hypothetical protein